MHVSEREGTLPEGSTEALLGPMEERLCGGLSGVAGCVVFSMRRLHILRRLGRQDEVDALFTKLTESAKSAGPKVMNHFALKHARFLTKQGDTAGALTLLREAAKREPVRILSSIIICILNDKKKQVFFFDIEQVMR